MLGDGVSDNGEPAFSSARSPYPSKIGWFWACIIVGSCITVACWFWVIIIHICIMQILCCSCSHSHWCCFSIALFPSLRRFTLNHLIILCGSFSKHVLKCTLCHHFWLRSAGSWWWLGCSLSFDLAATSCWCDCSEWNGAGWVNNIRDIRDIRCGGPSIRVTFVLNKQSINYIYPWKKQYTH